MGYRAGERPSPARRGQASGRRAAGRRRPRRSYGPAHRRHDRENSRPARARWRALCPQTVAADRRADRHRSRLGARRRANAARAASARSPNRTVHRHRQSPRQLAAGAVESFVAEFPAGVTADDRQRGRARRRRTAGSPTRITFPPSRARPPAVDVQLRAIGAGTERTVRLTAAPVCRSDRTPPLLDPEQADRHPLRAARRFRSPRQDVRGGARPARWLAERRSLVRRPGRRSGARACSSSKAAARRPAARRRASRCGRRSRLCRRPRSRSASH